MTIKANTHEEFFLKYMRLHALSVPLFERELQVAAQFLTQRHIYLKNPIVRFMVDAETGLPTDQVEEMMMLDQLKSSETLAAITKNLSMEYSVLRKHVLSLKEKGFFGKTDISSKFTPADSLQTRLTLKYEKS